MNMQFNFRPNQPKQNNYQNPSLVYPYQSLSGISLYSSLQGHSMIQNNSINSSNNQFPYAIGGGSPGMLTNTINNDYCLQGRSMPNQSLAGQLNLVSKSSIQNNKKYIQSIGNVKN
jgi:hypothetical protein